MKRYICYLLITFIVISTFVSCSIIDNLKDVVTQYTEKEDKNIEEDSEGEKDIAIKKDVETEVEKDTDEHKDIDKNNSGNIDINENTTDKLKSLSDEYILNFINEARMFRDKVIKSVEHTSYRLDGYGDQVSFYKCIYPYDTPERRREIISKYYIDENMLSGVMGNIKPEDKDWDTLYKQNGEYYIIGSNPPTSWYTVFDNVISKEVINGKLEVVLDSLAEQSTLDGGAMSYILVVKNGEVKIEKETYIPEGNNISEEKSDIFEGIERTSNEILGNITGSYSLVYKDLNTGDELSLNNGKVQAASVIKLFVAIDIYKAVKAGILNLDTSITIEDSMIVGGSGVIQNEGAGGNYTIRELIYLMLAKSDNIAANILIDMVGIRSVNTTIKNLGCIDSELNRKLMDVDAIERGIDNYTSVNDLALVLDKLYRGNCIGSGYDEEMLSIMKEHNLKNKIPNELPYGTEVAHKSGELVGVENDAAIVYTSKGAYILCILTNNGENSEEINAVSSLSGKIYDLYITN